MTLELRCGKVVDGCPGVIQGETQDEVMSQAATHAADAHGITEVDEDLERQLVGAIETV